MNCAMAGSSRESNTPPVVSVVAGVRLADTRGEMRRATGYYESGQLQSEHWSTGGTDTKLTFHENGRLKSEERFSGGDLLYAAYNAEDGGLERRAGDPVDWALPGQQ